MLKTVGNVVLVSLFAVLCTVYAANLKDSCPLPPELKSNYDYDWSLKSTEWSNTEAESAFLQLVISWTGTFCNSLPESTRNRTFQCRNMQHFDHIVHGLWPQAARASSVRHHPRNCRNEPQLNSTFIKRYFCLMPDEYLIQAEWEKHGTCYYKTATDYYTTTERLYKSLNIPNIQSLPTITSANVKNAFTSSNPKLFSSAIRVTLDEENRLKEVAICYDLKHQFVSCYS